MIQDHSGNLIPEAKEVPAFDAMFTFMDRVGCMYHSNRKATVHDIVVNNEQLKPHVINLCNKIGSLNKVNRLFNQSKKSYTMPFFLKYCAENKIQPIDFISVGSLELRPIVEAVHTYVSESSK